MRILKNIFGQKEQPIKSYADFWEWFQTQEQSFFNIVKNHKNIEKDFFDKLSPKLAELKEGYFYVTGMYDENTVELILTADGNTKNIFFVEELVKQAPTIKGWKFTALKPALDIDDVLIRMGDLEFNTSNISFYSNEHENRPDEIDISIIHNDMNDENSEQIINGVYIFLDNYLGELDFVNNIDNLDIIAASDAKSELIPISNLKDFLKWRQKEFIEKYYGTRYDTEHDEYSILEAELESGNMLIAVINTQLLTWDSKASHPWIAIMTLKYDGEKNNGMPNEKDLEKLNNIEEELLIDLKDKDGYLNIGRQTANNEREIYFACKDYRTCSKVFYEIQKKYASTFEIEFDIYKDKYWQSFDRFIEK